MGTLQHTGMNAPASRAIEITPSDTADIGPNLRGLHVSVAGTLTVTTIGGDTVSFVNVVGIFPVRCRRVFSTGTSATGIVGLY